MRKWLSIIALAILTVGLIVGGIILFVQVGYASDQFAKLPAGYDGPTFVQTCGLELGGGIAMFLGGIAAGIMTIANFFKMKVRDAD